MWYSAFRRQKVWGCGIIKRAPGPLAAKSIGGRGVKKFFYGKRAWRPPSNATPSNFLSPKCWVSELSSEVLFVSVQALIPSKLWTQMFSGIDFYTLHMFQFFSVEKIEIVEYNLSWSHAGLYLKDVRIWINYQIKNKHNDAQ